ncbi:tRNA (adenosine(37)-N6)-threonylcarbamoyltransferase complex ATPase subunit type 1 TsaE [Pelagibius sp. CAU 1746]|uniref:tRNA (adenosine(37)-N6)-threonylcarbamoyltransferase complex ATPase subunit type 1 TsaE n=1 Tax=Pelagibius sp. CAU 1746 TaxID=3140370 RepID=UPI00325A8E37
MMTATPRPSARALPLTLPLPALEATERLGRALAALLRPGDVVALHGDLGAGKTALARALIRALPGRPGNPVSAAEEEVPSPTFTLVQIYDRDPAPVWHFDLYRIEDPAEIRELGLSEALAEGITLIEWPERLGGRLPAGALSVTLSYREDAGGSEGAREARLDGAGDWPERLAELHL